MNNKIKHLQKLQKIPKKCGNCNSTKIREYNKKETEDVNKNVYYKADMSCYGTSKECKKEDCTKCNKRDKQLITIHLKGIICKKCKYINARRLI